jgi:hypothetical protein
MALNSDAAAWDQFMSRHRDLDRALGACSSGRFDEAVAVLEQTALGVPDPPPAVLAGLAFALFQARQYSKSFDCWEKLLKRGLPGRSARIRMNLARAAYMAAELAAREGRFDAAAHMLGIYCGEYPGDKAAERVSTEVEKLRMLSEAVEDVRSARDLADRGEWQEVVGRLSAVRARIGAVLDNSVA